MATGAVPASAQQEGRVLTPALWVICGVGRGVGKTMLALDLCRALPEATYAKQGTSRRRDEKPANYFHGDDELEASFAAEAQVGRRHLVFESNALARRGLGDMIIFLDAPVGSDRRCEPRADAGDLREMAHFRMGRVLAESAQGSETEAPDERSGAALQAAKMKDLREHLASLGLDPTGRSAAIGVLQAQDAWNRGRLLS